MEERIIRILSEFTDMKPEDITAATRLTADMGFSSLDIVNAAVLLEDEFNLEIPERNMAEFFTIGDVAAYLKKHAPKAAD